MLRKIYFTLKNIKHNKQRTGIEFKLDKSFSILVSQ